jgi:hypothetical protein
MGIVVVNGQVPILFVERGLYSIAANWLIIKKSCREVTTTYSLKLDM